MSKRSVKLYLDDILEAGYAIKSYLNTYDLESLMHDRKTYSATLREFMVIGEAISHLDEDFKESHPNIQWRMIKDFRNFIIHEYFGVDPEIVWDAATLELPGLLESVEDLVKTL